MEGSVRGGDRADDEIAPRGPGCDVVTRAEWSRDARVGTDRNDADNYAAERDSADGHALITSHDSSDVSDAPNAIDATDGMETHDTREDLDWDTRVWTPAYLAVRRAVRRRRQAAFHWVASQCTRLVSTPRERLMRMRRRPPVITPRRSRVPRLQRSSIVLLMCLLVSLLGGIPATVFAVVQYREVSGLVHDSLQHLRNAETDAKDLAQRPFDTATLGALRGELVTAHADFDRVDARLQLVPASLRVGALGGAQRLLPIALEGTQAGITACDAFAILASALKNPLDAGPSPQTQGLTPQATGQLLYDVDQVVEKLDTILPQINALQPSDLSLDSRLGPAIAGFKSALPQFAQMVMQVQAIAHLAPPLLGVGQPANYLVEVLDSTELRPGGGFIGNYGILTLSGGRMAALHIQDVDLLDAGVKYQGIDIPLPRQYRWFSSVFPRWGFRDSNLDADFPTSAQNAEQLYATELRDARQSPVALQGVIAITPALIQNALKITGPLYVPAYKETVTSDNLISRIHYHALGTYTGPDTQYDPASGSSLRKRFTGLVFQAFMAKMKQALSGSTSIAGSGFGSGSSGGNLGRFGQLVIDALRSKDLQVYLNRTSAEAMLQQFHLDSAIGTPHTGDSLFEVDANISGNKANAFLTYALADQITLDAAGNATHHLTLTYTWPPNPQSLIEDYAAGSNYLYEAFSRVYAPPGAVLHKQAGWITPGSSSAFARREWYGIVDVFYGRKLTVSLTWTVPHVATHDASGWHYQLLLQKQAGITWQASVKVNLPTCATMVGRPVGAAANIRAGTPASMQHTSTSSVEEPLANDLRLMVDYRGC